jgi:hypothetical membrane protein
MEKHETMSLRVAMAVPFLYFGTQGLGSLFYPGYSYLRQTASELGARGSPHPAIFNVGTLIQGFALLISAFGFFRALQHLGARPVLTWLTSSVLALGGVNSLLAGLFPLPDPRHAGLYLSYAYFFGPVLFAITLWRRNEANLLKAYLIATNILMIAAFALMTGVGGLDTHAYVGLFQRILGLTAFPWITVAAYTLKQRVAKLSKSGR